MSLSYLMPQPVRMSHSRPLLCVEVCPGTLGVARTSGDPEGRRKASIEIVELVTRIAPQLALSRVNNEGVESEGSLSVSGNSLNMHGAVAGPLLALTDDGRHVSIVASLTLLRRLVRDAPENAIELDEHEWRALQVSCGDPSNQDTLVAGLADSMAAVNISIMYLSTADMEYVCVPSSQLDEALRAICSNFVVDFVGDALHTADVPVLGPPKAPESDSRHPLYFGDVELTLCKVRCDDVLALCGAVVRELLSSPQNSFGERFFHFCCTEDEATLLLDAASAGSLYPEGTVVPIGEPWRLIRVGDSELGFEEAGIVAAVAHPLALAGVGCFYVSTYMLDYLVVPVSQYDDARIALSPPPNR